MIQPDPFVWLYSIDVPSSPRTKLRLAAYHETVYFERDSTGAGLSYLPSSVVHEEVERDTEGSIPQVKLEFQNVTRESIAILETYGGLVGEKVRTALVKLADGIDAAPAVDEVYEVLESQADEVNVQLTLGRVALTQRKFPDRRISRTYCAHRYGGPGCGYDTTRAGALQTCTKLLGSDTVDDLGCKHHGRDEAAATLTVRHPQRMLFFPGVPRSSGVGVS